MVRKTECKTEYADKVRACAEDIALTFNGSSSRLLLDEPMASHSTFRTGGTADLTFSISNDNELVYALGLADKHCIPITLIGNGSNILVSDKGIRGLVILIAENMSKIELESYDTIVAEAGASLAAVSRFAGTNHLTGMEFAGGIPGTIGGAVYMNAGAYDGCMADIIVKTKGYDLIEKRFFTLSDLGSHDFGYRKSFFSSGNAVVLSAWFHLAKGSRQEIEAKVAEFALRRRASQPLELPSAGSTFKRPSGSFAGKLIESSGLKGCRVGGASVSEKHAGFIVNDSNATASDILKLIHLVQQVVFDKHGVMLEPEVKVLGDW